MPLPAPNLDDLRFQRDLVDEARRRIVQYCPEWTDYNLSDPGITLIELFAWMTELMLYRLNRVPDKNYIKFMELLGIQLQPASSARTELSFWLSVPFPINEDDDTIAVVPEHIEVTNRPLDGEDEVIFTTDQRLTIAPPRLTQLRRAVDFARNYLPRLAVQDCRVFRDQDPQRGDTFYLGFDENRAVNGYIMRLSFTCLPTQATGIRRDDPPLVWECSLGDGRWHELRPSERQGELNTTGGLNNPTGEIVFYLPLAMAPDEIDGISAYWIRCRFEQRHPGQGDYSRSPRVAGVQAHALGATTTATHATLIENEQLGATTGEPGQTFLLQSVPILQPTADEVLEIEEWEQGEVVFVPWKRVEDFSRSSRYDRHYLLDTSTGEIQLGPSIRQRDGQMQQYGRVPEANRLARFTRYRAGGGVAGNLPPNRVNVLRSTLPYINAVTNLRRAEGGRDAETLDEAKIRVPQELRTQQRAVTAADFEDLTLKASRSVARVHCLTPANGKRSPAPGTVTLLVVPACYDALQVGDLSGLYLPAPLIQQIEQFLDRYRLLTTTLLVREPAYMGVQVNAYVVSEAFIAPEVVRSRVNSVLQNFLSPLPLDAEDDAIPEVVEGVWEGWPFGRSLYLSDIHALIQQVPGVRHVQDVQALVRQVAPARETPRDEDGGELPAANDSTGLTPIVRSLALEADTLLCSLVHQVVVVDARTGLPYNNGAHVPPPAGPLSVPDGANPPYNPN